MATTVARMGLVREDICKLYSYPHHSGASSMEWVVGSPSFLFPPLLPEGAHQNQKGWLWKVGRGGIHAPLLLWAPQKKFPALLCSMCSKTLPSCASLPLFLKRSWFSLVIITVGKSHLMKWGAILQSWVHDLGSRAGPRGGHACPGSSASCRRIIFHKKLMFTSQSLLKFKLAGDTMFTMHNINLFC